eukprot:scaffold41305_cov41-Phaeocystis_antarctica.AAC.3
MAGMTHGRRQWASLPGSREARGRLRPRPEMQRSQRPFDPARAAGPATAGEKINHPRRLRAARRRGPRDE